MEFLHQEYFFFWPVILIILVLLIRKRFVNLKNYNPDTIRVKKIMKMVVFVSRLAIFSLLLIALAGPFQETRTKIQGNLKLTILYDNSTSMDIFERNEIPKMMDELKKELPIQMRTIANGLKSPIGDGVLGALEQDSNVLLISDGNANEGVSMADLGIFAASMNSTISTIMLDPIKKDVGVAVYGPTKTVTNAENNFLIRISHFGTKDYSLAITIDDQVVPETDYKVSKGDVNDEIIINKKFENGYHKIMAKGITSNDYYPQNNIFYKTIHVVDKPNVLFVTQKTDPLRVILNELYDVTETAMIPNDLSKYYTVILNDIPSESIRNLEPLTNFVIDGNGLVVVGGEHSFDGGGYKNTLIESILPVTIGKGERKRGNSNIVAVIDISGTSGETYELINGELVKTTGREQKGLSLSKALAMSVIESLSQSNKVGAIAFATEAYKIEDINPLYQNKKVLLDKMSRLVGSGQSYFHIGLMGANELLKSVQGDKNVILFTDGQSWNDGVKQQTIDISATLAGRGTKVYVVGVGTNIDEEFLKQVAENGNGIYFKATEANKFKVIFGEAEDRPSVGPAGLVLLNSNHFITKDLDIDCVLAATNQVIPKSNSQLLVTNDGGEPVVTVWRYGLGKVTTITGFTGDTLGELLAKRNSRLLTRIFNWNIGDPERKKEYIVLVEDTKINTQSKVFVKSKKIPTFKDMEFMKVEKNMYQSLFIPTVQGFHMILEATYAANYEKEYENLGMNPELNKVVATSGGKLFKDTEANKIIEFVKSSSRRERLEKKDLKEEFIFIAMIIFLVEIALRRFKENEML